MRPAPDPSPWELDPRDGGDAFEAAPPPAGEPGGRGARPPGHRSGPSGGAPDGFDERASRISRRVGTAPRRSPSSSSGALRPPCTQPSLGHPLKSVIVTSASPGDGKSHVAVNLALTLSGSYQRRLLLIDAGPAPPVAPPSLWGRQHSRPGRRAGGEDGPAVAAVQISETLTLLPAGKPASNPCGRPLLRNGSESASSPKPPPGLTG